MLNEKMENIGGEVFATQSAFDIRNWLINRPLNYKIIYDDDLKYYFIVNGMLEIHSFIFRKAVLNGFYPNFMDYTELELNHALLDAEEMGQLCCFCFDPDGDSMIDQDRCDDGYPIKHTYPFGAIYERTYQGFSAFCPLFTLLGEPLNTQTLEESYNITALNNHLNKLLD